MKRKQGWRFGRWLGGSVLLIVIVALTGVPGSAPAAASTTNLITIQSFAFTPDNLVVPVGATVTWKNLDPFNHQVVSDTGAFPSSAPLPMNATYMVTFTQPGSYVYHCGIHPGMVHKMITVIQPDIAPGRHPNGNTLTGILPAPGTHPTVNPESGALNGQPPRH